MKRLMVFILLLASSFLYKGNACGFYPYGEDVRFCFFSPRYFNFDNGYRYFNYVSDWYDYSPDDESDSYYSGMFYYEPNVNLWKQYCNGRVADDAIVQAIYKIQAAEINPRSKNAMLRYLYAKKDIDAINYILFAKQCEQYTYENNDPWEKNENKSLKPAQSFIKEAGINANKVKNAELKKRYLFLKVRLARYYGNDEDIAAVYNAYFKNAEKDLLYYWVLYYYATLHQDPAERNYYAAQVFAHAADRRFVVRTDYDRTIPVEEALKFAKTREEAANIWLLEGIRAFDKGLPYIKNIYKNDPKSHGLTFMLVREINKLEDWVLTPQYSLFEPSTRPDYWENNNAYRILERVKQDRLYAKEVLDFVAMVDFSKTENPELWMLAKTYLAFMAKDNDTAITALATVEKNIHKDNPLFEPSQLVKGLVLTAAQSPGHAVIPDAVKQIVLDQYKAENYKYIFGIGRELEEKGNAALAALLFSRSNSPEADDWLGGDTAYWKAKNNVASMYSNYYMNYLSYTDAAYTTGQMQSLIALVNNFKGGGAFDRWLYADAVAKKHELYRILGTKFLRENKLAEAGSAFEQIDSRHDYIFDENPFYKIKFTPEFTPDYNKKQKVDRAYIMSTLISVLGKAGNTAEKDRDYYNFLAGNCYYNMSFYGSAWNISRRYKSSGQWSTDLTDDEDFFQCKKAAYYYAQAYRFAKTEKFKALCLRMMAECEGNRLTNVYERDRYMIDRYGLARETNKYDALLEKKYSRAYKELYESNCTAFQDYFKARR